MRVGRSIAAICMACVLVAGWSRTCPAAEIAWRSSLDEAGRQAERESKPLLVRITADWCTHCRKMEWRAFKDERVIEHINGNYVPVELDADANEEALESFDVKVLPTTIVLTAELEEVARISGYQSPDEFRGHLLKIAAVQPHRSTRFAGTSPPERLPEIASSSDVAQRPSGSHAAGRDAAGSGTSTAGGFAFGGYCLVSMYEEESLQPGSDRFFADYRGSHLRFATASHRQRFLATPEKYWPALDGACPVSAVDDETRRDGDPRHAIIYHEKLWLLADPEHEERFFTAAAKYYRKLQ